MPRRTRSSARTRGGATPDRQRRLQSGCVHVEPGAPNTPSPSRPCSRQTGRKAALGEAMLQDRRERDSRHQEQDERDAQHHGSPNGCHSNALRPYRIAAANGSGHQSRTCPISSCSETTDAHGCKARTERRRPRATRGSPSPAIGQAAIPPSAPASGTGPAESTTRASGCRFPRWRRRESRAVNRIARRTTMTVRIPGAA